MEKVLFSSLCARFYYERNGVPKAQRIQFKFQVPQSEAMLSASGGEARLDSSYFSISLRLSAGFVRLRRKFHDKRLLMIENFGRWSESACRTH